MYTRAAVAGDYGEVAAVDVAAHIDVDEMEAYLYPRRHTHRDAYQQLHLWEVRQFAAVPQCCVIVAVTEPTDKCWRGKPEIAGYSKWSREGDSEATRKRWRKEEGLASKVKRRVRFSVLAGVWTDLLNPATSMIHRMRFGREDDRFFHPSFKNPKEHWWANAIAVAPAFQRNGVAMMLLEWGKVHAREEQVPIMLASTTIGRGLYDKAGFWNYGTWTWGPGKGMQSALMRWDPPGKEP